MNNTSWIARCLMGLLIVGGMASVTTPAYSHFQMIIPSDNIVSAGESRRLNLDLIFTHPFEGMGLNMKQPKRFGVWVAGKEIDLLKFASQEITFSLSSLSLTGKRLKNVLLSTTPKPW